MRYTELHPQQNNHQNNNKDLALTDGSLASSDAFVPTTKFLTRSEMFTKRNKNKSDQATIRPLCSANISMKTCD